MSERVVVYRWVGNTPVGPWHVFDGNARERVAFEENSHYEVRTALLLDPDQEQPEPRHGLMQTYEQALIDIRGYENWQEGPNPQQIAAAALSESVQVEQPEGGEVRGDEVDRLKAIREIVGPASEWPSTDVFAELARAVMAVLDAESLAALSTPSEPDQQCTCRKGNTLAGKMELTSIDDCPVHAEEPRSELEGERHG